MSKTVSEKDAAFLACVIRNVESQPRVNWKAVTTEMGFKNEKSTRTRYSQIKQKLEATMAAGPGVKKRSEASNDAGEAEISTPATKRARKSGGIAAAASSPIDKDNFSKVKGEFVKYEPPEVESAEEEGNTFQYVEEENEL